MDIKPDLDPQETREWLDAIDGVLEHEGPDRAHFLIEQVIDKARRSGAYMPFSASTAYINTIPVDKQVRIPGDQAIEHRIRSYVRWNAMAMVVRANKHTNVGGHIASFASSATLYDVGFNHFWHAPSDSHGGDLVFGSGVLRHIQRDLIAVSDDRHRHPEIGGDGKLDGGGKLAHRGFEFGVAVESLAEDGEIGRQLCGDVQNGSPASRSLRHRCGARARQIAAAVI